MAEYERKLYRLSELDEFKVADEDPDIRGWKLVDGQYNRIGTVNELLADPDAKRVRYLDVVLDREFWHSDDERHVLIPVGLAAVDDDADQVIVDRIDRANLLEYPVYTGEAITRDYEHGLIEKLHGERSREDDFYNSDYFRTDRIYGRRKRVNVR